jgi:hypothetical protein
LNPLTGSDACLVIERDFVVVEALAARSTLKQRDPEDLSRYFMSGFTLEALGRHREAAAGWRHITSWLEAHDDTVHTTWPKETLGGIKAICMGTTGGSACVFHLEQLRYRLISVQMRAFSMRSATYSYTACRPAR